jgi:N utilization substance protein B
MRHRESVDEAIQKNAINFEFHRLSAVDRNVLRVAAYEILHCPDVPPAVAINEAIEIAKKFSTGDSGKFVNGVLDNIRKQYRANVKPAAK